MKANVRAALPAVEVYDADNIGTASDVDASAAPTGYAGMTLALLQSYDGAVKNVTVGSASSTTYCVKSTVGGKVWYKNGPSADIDNSNARAGRVLTADDWDPRGGAGARAHLFTGSPTPTGFTP